MDAVLQVEPAWKKGFMSKRRALFAGFPRLVGVAGLFLAFLIPLLPATPALAASAQTISRFSTSDKVILLTLDTDGIRGYAPGVLDTLESKGVRVSWGVTGEFASGNGDLVKRMAQDGDTIMNHSWDHPDFTTISGAQIASELQRTDTLIQQLTGFSTKPYFRPPYGAYNSSVLSDLGADGYRYNVMWSIDPQGWRGKPASEITSLILAGANPGAIVLMHSTDAGDAGALAGVIDQLRARGYRFATIGDFLGNQAPPPPPPPQTIFFPQTGHSLSHGFLRYWQQFGGLPIFGYPITEEYTDPQTGIVTQYFERARFEWHPGAWPSHYDVELGLLGVELAQQEQLTGTAPFQPVMGSENPNCTFYPQTGHWLCFGFRDYWQSHGGLTIFGYPISEEFTDPATGLTVQYFERQRLEYHPENPPAWQVEGGLLGDQLAPQPK
jgi:peptidoglycan/xylan/chitin deacetylase (PgdA/CDA1 family)